ncbi:MAG: archease [Planctomycetaceae bacterium]|nr:archease [Planctomycetales bacterium]MCB9872637.1 archease [Planctomycetaceae bacterium]MCB9939537.1 archease [Planctomycetaceae bacterium]
MFETFEHTADLGLRIRATTQEQLLEDAGRGLFSMLVTNLEDVRCLQERTYRVEGVATDYLLFDWLNELLFTFESERLLLSEFHVVLDAEGLWATANGEPMDLARHRMEHEVKAITYHGLRVEKDAVGWFAELIVDI